MMKVKRSGYIMWVNNESGLNNATLFHVNRRPYVAVNEYLESNQSYRSRYPKTVPGNSSYASINSTVKKKVALFTDSICSRIRMKKFNSKLDDGKNHRKSFLGTAAQDIEHFSIRSLDKDPPDVAVIHAGSNSIQHENPYGITESTLKIVESCKKYEVNEVFVSSLIYDPRYRKAVRKVNAILKSYKKVDEFSYSQKKLQAYFLSLSHITVFQNYLSNSNKSTYLLC